MNNCDLRQCWFVDDGVNNFPLRSRARGLHGNASDVDIVDVDMHHGTVFFLLGGGGGGLFVCVP